MPILSVTSLLATAMDALRSAHRNRVIRYSLLALIIVDAFLLLTFVAYAIVEFFDITSSYLYGRTVFSTADWSLIECSCYFKEAICVGMLGIMAWRTRSILFGALTFFVAAVLADDSLRFHEVIGRHVAAAGVYKPLAELVASMIYGVIPAIVLLLAWLREGEARRRDSLPIVAALALLLFFAVIVDVIRQLTHKIITDGEKIAALIEDGGELLSLTLLVVIVAGTCSRIMASSRTLGDGLPSAATAATPPFGMG